MKPMCECQNRELLWSQPIATKRDFELHDGAELVASLRWHRQTGSLATGATAEGSWSFKRAGFLCPRVTIWRADTTEQVSTFEAGWAGGGQLLFPDGHGYYWRQLSFWHDAWGFETERREIVTQFKTGFPILKESVQLKIMGVDNIGPDLSLLAALGLYLMILSNDDTTATIANSTLSAIM